MFETRAKVLRTIEKKIERRLQKVLGFNVPVFIRTHAEVKQIVALEPFENSEVHGADVNLILLAENLDESSGAKLMALRTGTDGVPHLQEALAMTEEPAGEAEDGEDDISPE